MASLAVLHHIHAYLGELLLTPCIHRKMKGLQMHGEFPEKKTHLCQKMNSIQVGSQVKKKKKKFNEMEEISPAHM